MEMYAYLEDLASSKSAPGGGSAAAYAGSMGAALGNMVLNITIEKQKNADKELLSGLVAHMTVHQKNLFDLVKGDEEASTKLFDAYKLPKNTEEEKATRLQAIQDGLKIATEVPLDVMKNATHALEIMIQVVELGRKSVLADVTVGTSMLKTAVLAANENVVENVEYLKDTALSATFASQAEDFIARTNLATELITKKLETR